MQTSRETTHPPVTLVGERTFNWIESRSRRPSEYETVTVGLQTTPEEWLHVDWPVRFEDGRPPWSVDASRVRTSIASSYRDPSELWQRPYVDDMAKHQHTLERLIPVWTADMASVDEGWLDLLGRTYAAWPFVEYGLFLALAYVVRQCRADTIEFMVSFQAFDRLRLEQDIVQHVFRLNEDVPSFSDAGARDAWMTDPALTPIREVVEHIIASNDWFEILVAINFAFEPLIGTVAKRGLFTAIAALHGDSATPLVVAQSVLDTERTLQAMTDLVKLVSSDPHEGATNKAVIGEWITSWGTRCRKAAAEFVTAFPTAELGAAALAAAEGRFEDALVGIGGK